VTTAVVVGNPKPASRTLTAAQLVVERLTGRGPDLTVDLTGFGAKLLDWSDPEVSTAVADVQAADLVVFASPTYKASYTGLLKLFLDRFSAGSLSSVSAVPLLLGGDWRHSLAPEAFLKPVLAELGASTPTRGLFLLDSDIDGEVLRDWLDVAKRQLPQRALAPAAHV
jgi:FMN reductase